jgi:hypothetical protein
MKTTHFAKAGKWGITDCPQIAPFAFPGMKKEVGMIQFSGTK